MPFLKTLVVGGGIAGPALAFWLAKLGHDVTVVDRSPDLRASGQQIDIRGQALNVLRRMGLLEAVRAKIVQEEGMQFQDVNGKPYATLLANKTGKGAQTFTAEYEIMRGDLCRILADASVEAGAKYVFGKGVVGLEQDGDAATAYFSDGTSDRFDLVVGADGQGSKVRRLIMTPEDERIKSLGVHHAFFTIPREPIDTGICGFCMIPNGYMLLRSGNPKTTQVYLSHRPTDEETIRALQRPPDGRDAEIEKKVWTELFRNRGWQSERILRQLNRPGGPQEEFYAHEMIQVKTKTWSKGRIVLLGDAAHCASPASGSGTAAAIVGAYVLAGEVSKHYDGKGDGGGDDGVVSALQSYDQVLRPFAEDVQSRASEMTLEFMAPRTWWRIRVVYFIFWLLTALRLDVLAAGWGSDDIGNWKLPEYPSLPASS